MKFKYHGKLSRIRTNGKSPLEEGQPTEVTGTFTDLPHNGRAFAIHADHSQSTLYPEGFYRMTSIVEMVGPMEAKTEQAILGQFVKFDTINSTYILSEIKELK